jgi:hypothetical protein
MTPDTSSSDLPSIAGGLIFSINMCKGMELCLLDTEIKGSIKTFRSMNVSEDEIVERVAELFNVKKDYVKELMTPKAV